MLFHKASHSLEGKIDVDLQKELSAREMLFKRRGFDPQFGVGVLST